MLKLGEDIAVEDAVNGLRESVRLGREEGGSEDAPRAFIRWVNEDEEIAQRLGSISQDHLIIGMQAIEEHGEGVIPTLVYSGIVSAWLMGYVAGRNHGQ